jgi:ferredoxin
MPFMWVADIKILTLMLAPLYLLVVAIAGVISMGFGAVWCRYLCPVGGLYALVGEASPCLVHRDEDLCTHCGRCARVCHAFVDVDKRGTVRDTECDGCMECVRSCPTPGALEARAAGRLRIAPWMWVVLVVALWLGVFSAAKLTGNWDTRVTPAQFRAAANSGVLDAPSAPSSGGGQ